MSKKSMKKKTVVAKKQDNSRYFIIGMVVFMVLLFAVMLGSVMKKDSPASSSSDPNLVKLEQVMSRIATREARLKENPDDISITESLANDYYDAGMINLYEIGDDKQASFLLEEAVNYYLKVLDKKPKNMNVRVDMATISWRISSDYYEFADTHFKKAIAEDPNFLFARTNYGNFLFYALGDYAGAIEQWEAALKLKPSVQDIAKLTSQIDEAKQLLGN
ncbi:MAG: hypothetical protein SCK28_09595 [Bacillota bacterium]|nr:hypothetical protein [Bacillota bacterium]